MSSRTGSPSTIAPNQRDLGESFHPPVELDDSLDHLLVEPYSSSRTLASTNA